MASKPALEVNRESQQFEQIARATLLPAFVGAGKCRLRAFEIDEECLNRPRADDDVVQFHIAVAEALRMEFLDLFEDLFRKPPKTDECGRFGFLSDADATVRRLDVRKR